MREEQGAECSLQPRALEMGEASEEEDSISQKVKRRVSLGDPHWLFGSDNRHLSKNEHFPVVLFCFFCLFTDSKQPLEQGGRPDQRSLIQAGREWAEGGWRQGGWCSSQEVGGAGAGAEACRNTGQSPMPGRRGRYVVYFLKKNIF